MTTRPAAFDARILDKLAQVVAITRHHGWGSQADVVRVCQWHLGDHRNLRAEAAEKQVHDLRAQLQKVTGHGERVVELPRRQAEVLTAAAEGKPQQEIAAERGVCASNVSALLHRAAANIGADDLPTAIVLVRTGVITIKPRDVRRSRAA